MSYEKNKKEKEPQPSERFDIKEKFTKPSSCGKGGAGAVGR